MTFKTRRQREGGKQRMVLYTLKEKKIKAKQHHRPPYNRAVFKRKEIFTKLEERVNKPKNSLGNKIPEHLNKINTKSKCKEAQEPKPKLSEFF